MLIKFGSIVTDGRGKLGGQVYSKNRAGSYVRNNAIPSNPRTVAQMKSRNLLSQLSQGWSGLTQQERNAWEGATDKFPRKNVFGDSKELTGKNLFTSLNKNLMQVGESKLDTPPPAGDIVAIERYSASSDIAEDEFTAEIETDNANGHIVVRATAPVSAGTTYVRNKLRIVHFEPATAGANNIEFLSEYQDKFGALTAGDVVFLGFYTVNSAGVRSPEVTLRVEIQ